MSNGIPKSARDLLAKQTAADAHLSPDLLNAYAEHALNDAEKQQVTMHLASCADCREVLFLASAAVEDVQPALVAAAAAQRTLHPAATPATPTPEQPQACAVLEPRPKPPKLWWKWALPLTAVVIVGAAVLVERDRSLMRSATTEVAAVKSPPARQSSAPSPAVPAAPSTTASLPEMSDTLRHAKDLAIDGPVAGSKAKAQSAGRRDAAEGTQLAQAAKPGNERDAFQAPLTSHSESTLHSNALAADAAAPSAAAPVVSDKAAKAAPRPPTAQSAEAASAAPLVQGANGGNDLTYVAPDAKTQVMAKSLTNDQRGALATLEMDRSGEAAKTRWRISRDGHVEHTVASSTWEQVMAAEPVTFRVVATVGNNIWAGGSDGALFRSTDGGKHWARVALADEHGTITTIRFNSAQQGIVTSASGTTWETLDGGRTWSKQ